MPSKGKQVVRNELCVRSKVRRRKGKFIANRFICSGPTKALVPQHCGAPLMGCDRGDTETGGGGWSVVITFQNPSHCSVRSNITLPCVFLDTEFLQKQFNIASFGHIKYSAIMTNEISKDITI
jgi:hypothetical protein